VPSGGSDNDGIVCQDGIIFCTSDVFCLDTKGSTNVSSNGLSVAGGG
jgi:hypothetical protein